MNRCLTLSAMFLLVSSSVQAQDVTPTPLPPPIPVILDTDIGDDIDDTWALGLILASPELDLKLVVTDSHDVESKTRLVAKFLHTVGRGDIPIGKGIPGEAKPNPQYTWAEDYDISTYPGEIYEDGIQAIINTVLMTPETDTLLVIGPCPNIRELLNRAPNIVDHVRVIAMSGSVDRGYGQNVTPDAEYNVRDDIRAAQAMYNARWPLTIAPLDTAARVRLGGTRYQDMLRRGDLLMQTIMENYIRYAEGKPQFDTQIASTPLYDTVPVYLAIDDAFLEMQTIRLQVDFRGYTVRSSSGNPIRVAMKWKNLTAYQNWVMERIERGVFLRE